jgi:hypothetical protein
VSGKPAGQVNRQQVEVPSQRHVDLYRLLESSARRDQAGRLVAWWPQAKLAAQLGVSVRTVRNLLADLRQPGLDPRHPRGVPPGLRLGLVKVEGTNYLDPVTGRHRLGGNLYVLVDGYIPWSGQQATKKGHLTSGDADPVACLNKEQPEPLQGDGSLGGHWPTTGNEPSEPVEIAVEPPAALQLDHDPSLAEVLGTLGRAFGPVQVLAGPATYRTARGRVIDLASGPTSDLHQAIDQLQRHTCWRRKGGSERCTPRRPCGRHARRARPA